ncbi:MAG: GAF domain-containing sensor histidine kinase, partial [Anaerolineales bacterium]|nr:GAF domain-containing sensor histidine kinase [Anaerolineales bacterium]
ILLSKVCVFLQLYSQRRALEEANGQLQKINQTLTERNVQMQTTQAVGEQTASILSLDKLLTAVVDLVHQQFNYPFVGIWMYEKHTSRFYLQASSDNQLLAPGHALTAVDVLEDVMAHNQISYVSDFATLDQAFRAIPDIQSIILVPLVVHEQPLAVLDVRYDEFDAEQKDTHMLRMLANQVASAIRNAQLYERIMRFNEELEDTVEERTAELADAYNKLEKLDRNKSDFIEVVAHELRTPLSLIMGYGSLLRTEPELLNNEMYKVQLDGIHTGAKRMLEIINTMLDIIKIDNHSLQFIFEIMSLTAVFSKLQEQLIEILGDRHLTLILQNLDVLPDIQGDSEALEKLFYNLLINAIKFTPDGGHITVEGKVLGETDDELQAIEIIITDTGIGIDPEFHELIFTKFYQTGNVTLHSSGKAKFKGGGPGLGLAIARGIVEGHHGQIWVESEGYDEEHLPGSAFHTVLLVNPPIKTEALDSLNAHDTVILLEDVMNDFPS